MPHQMPQGDERKTCKTNERAHAEQKVFRCRENLQERHDERQNTERNNSHEIAKKSGLHAEKSVIQEWEKWPRN